MIKKIRCSKGHYYDSKYARCPYCAEEKRKAGGKSSIKDIISDKISGKRSKGKKKAKEETKAKISFDEGRTMHLGSIKAKESEKSNEKVEEDSYQGTVDFDDSRTQYTSQNARQFDSEKTQYLHQDSEDYDNGYTQFANQYRQTDKKPQIIDEAIEKEQSHAAIPNNAVIGWLVFMNGIQIGNDLRLIRGTNYIYLDDDEFLRMSESEERNSCFSISYDEIKNHYVISVLNGETLLNGKKITGERSLFNNSIISVNGLKLEIVMYCKGINKWKR